MTNISRTIKTLVASLAFLGLGVVAAPQLVNAYTGDYTGGDQPQFNIYDQVTGFGDESDFTRVGSAANSLSNSYEVCSGEAMILLYIHNGAPEAYNGAQYNGSGIAKDTTAKVNLTSDKSNKVSVTGTINASNALTVSDGAFLTCDDHKIDLTVLPDSAEVVTFTGDRYTISASQLTSNGSKVGTYAADGDLHGCWEQRITVRVKVKVEKYEEPKSAACSVLDVIPEGRTKRILRAGQPVLQNTNVTGYTFSVKNSQGQLVYTESTNADDREVIFETSQVGDYTAHVTVHTGIGDASDDPDCSQPITIEPEPIQPIYECTIDVESLGGNRRVNIYLRTVASPESAVSLKSGKITIDDLMGDYLKTFNQVSITNYQFPDYSKYLVTGEATFDVTENNQTRQETVTCEHQISLSEPTPETPTPETPVTTITDTGAGGVMAIFAGISAFAAKGYQAVLRRRQ